MAFPPGFLDELRSRVSLSGLVARRVKLERRGREFAGLCPFHNEKTPSFYVVDDKNFFHCFGCGAHGDVIGFVMRADHLDFVEAVEKLAAEAGLPVPKPTAAAREQARRQKTLLETLEAAAAFYEARLWSPVGAPARDYLFGRGLDADTIRRFRLGLAPDQRHGLRRALAPEHGEALLTEAGLLHRPADGEPYDYFRNRIMFPIGDRAGRVIAFGGRVFGPDATRANQPKYLNSPESPVFRKGRVLYGWAAARLGSRPGPERAAGREAIVVEGYMDVIALHQAGFATAVAPLGTALGEDQLQELWRLGPEPILCFDGDEGGRRCVCFIAPCRCCARASACVLRHCRRAKTRTRCCAPAGPPRWPNCWRRRDPWPTCCGKPRLPARRAIRPSVWPASRRVCASTCSVSPIRGCVSSSKHSIDGAAGRRRPHAPPAVRRNPPLSPRDRRHRRRRPRASSARSCFACCSTFRR